MNTYRCLVFVIGFAVGIALPARSAVPPLISYQSLLRTSGGGPVADGPYEVAFRLYEDSAGGIPVWEESQTVQTSGGVFHVLLGAINPVSPGAFATDLYLGVGIDAGAEMTPRVRLVSVGYAMAAQNAYTLEGQTAADLDESSEITQAVASVADSINLSPFENLFRYYVSFSGAVDGEFAGFTVPAGENRYITGVYFIGLLPTTADYRQLTVKIDGSPVLHLNAEESSGMTGYWGSNGGAPLKVESGQSVSFMTATVGNHTVLITGYEF